METITTPGGNTYRLKEIRKWKDLTVVEANLPEGIDGISLPWEKPDEYRILINSELSEPDKLKTFIHEMIHLYRGDHEKKGESVQKIEAECHHITQEVLKSISI